jgi:hypothetical protein
MVTADSPTSAQGDTCVPCAAPYMGTVANTPASSLSNTDVATPHTCAGGHNLSDPGAGDHSRTNTDATRARATYHIGTACHFRSGTSSG